VYDNATDNHVSISRYSDLAGEQFGNSILIRSSSNIYNVSLVAAIIQTQGEEEASRFIEGIVNNMAREPQGNDRDQARAMVAGEGRYAIMNNYYLQRLLDGSDAADVMVGERVSFIYPDEVFEDISWAGIMNGANNRENAIKFIEFLIAEEQQRTIMNENGEAPANRSVPISDALAEQYAFNPMRVNFEELGRYTTRATILMDMAGWK
jgi:iron(III) transport system substrate-binding protein